ncbi:MAG: hypothetical protein K1X70_08135 [Leptospirales bacterium]|nr:hypothetical protein [Leptospirales bacterium]HMU81910.1 hypothetical protein [Leptospiraceae bacterium]HMW58091.1 hypothetical protein [Leptospiraceae bacterium]HMZ38571.1 hypothetical protein [Leptospiraceae bacterium]HNJ33701.1 hypothetical protein [Leptospiraceae bacterium]
MIARICLLLALTPLTQCLTMQNIQAARGAPTDTRYKILGASVSDEFAFLDVEGWQMHNTCSSDLDSSVHMPRGQNIPFTQCVSLKDGRAVDEEKCTKRKDFQVLEPWEKCCSNLLQISRNYYADLSSLNRTAKEVALSEYEKHRLEDISEVKVAPDLSVIQIKEASGRLTTLYGQKSGDGMAFWPGALANNPRTPATVNLPIARRRTLQINGAKFLYPEGDPGPDKFLRTTILTPQRPRPELWPFVPLMMAIDIVTLPFRILSEIGKFIVSPNKCYPLF